MRDSSDPLARPRCRPPARAFWFALLLVATLSAGRGQTEGRWIQLFNGRDLDDWTVKIAGHEAGENFGNTFRVEDGLLKVGYEGYETFDGRFGHLFYKDTFSHYRIRVEYRFVGEQCIISRCT